MLWLKRIICGIVALIFLIIGGKFVAGSSYTWQAIGFCIFIGGIILAYIAIMQSMPNYNFWVTLTAIGLALALFFTKNDVKPSEDNQKIETVKEDKKLIGKKKALPQKKKKRKLTGFNPSAYPKISGSASIIDAHVFYIGGRYIRLYGVDAPDKDQICSDENGASYNCGEEAVSWMTSWIDNNVIDCYILKLDPKGRDLATCIWGQYDIGAALVESGWALANYKETDIYVPYEVKAKNEFSGLWQGTFYSPEDWRDIKRKRNDFTIQRKRVSKGGGFFNFGSWF